MDKYYLDKIESVFNVWIEYINRDFGNIDNFLMIEEDFTEWLPEAREVYLIGEFNGWKRREVRLSKDQYGKWRVRLPKGTIKHGQAYKLEILNAQGQWKDRNQAYAKYMRQEPEGQFNCIYFESTYEWKNKLPLESDNRPLIIYEAHIGISSEQAKVATYQEFRTKVLPRVKAGGFNCLQLMAIPEHAYYGSFGYQITNLFAPSSRFGTPDDLKALCDDAHGLGLKVILDICLSHASTNSDDGIGDMDGSGCQYFYQGERGYQSQWDCRIYDLTKTEVIRFLINSLRYYVEEFKVDGFRIDAITSMLYRHHGICREFRSPEDYYSEDLDIDSVAFLKLAIHCIKFLYPQVIFIAEDASGFPGLGLPQNSGGIGFDYLHGMYCPDAVQVVLHDFNEKDKMDKADYLVFALMNRKRQENYISYVECHDQCINGGMTAIHRLLQDKSSPH